MGTISIIILNFNREQLLRNTVLSLLATTHCENEIIVVDNASSDGSRIWLEFVTRRDPRIRSIFMNENMGGEALNSILPDVKGDFVLVSENDLEYLPDWDKYMLSKFESFPKLGQLSPFSPYPHKEFGENWGNKPFEILRHKGMDLKVAKENVGTTAMFPRSLIEKGLQYQNIVSNDGQTKLPADSFVSSWVREHGYLVGWSDESQVINWGHNERTWADSSGRDYYRKNWMVKSRNNMDGLSKFQDVIHGIETLDSKCQIEVLTNELGQTLQELNYWKSLNPNQRSFRSFSTLYFDIGEGFQQSAIDQCLVSPYEKDFYCEFDLERFPNVKRIRWDPHEGHQCFIKIDRILLVDSRGHLKSIEFSTLSHNGFGSFENLGVKFLTVDPNVEFEIEGRNVKLKISGQWSLLGEESKTVEGFSKSWNAVEIRSFWPMQNISFKAVCDNEGEEDLVYFAHDQIGKMKRYLVNNPTERRVLRVTTQSGHGFSDTEIQVAPLAPFTFFKIPFVWCFFELMNISKWRFLFFLLFRRDRTFGLFTERLNEIK